MNFRQLMEYFISAMNFGKKDLHIFVTRGFFVTREEIDVLIVDILPPIIGFSSVVMEKSHFQVKWNQKKYKRIEVQNDRSRLMMNIIILYNVIMENPRIFT